MNKLAFDFKFPDVGEGIHEGDIVKLRVKEGDTVQQDQPIADIETAKAIVEIPSPKSGVVLKMHFKEGDTIKVGEVLVTIGEPGEKYVPAAPSAAQAKAAIVLQATKTTGAIATPLAAAPEGAILAPPAVRRLARELNVDLANVKGTGPHGRITEEDVKAAASGKAPASSARPASKCLDISPMKIEVEGPAERVPLKGLRKAIAENMARSVFTAPHATHFEEIDCTELVKLREKEKKNAEKKGLKLTFLPFMIKAVAAALQKNPYLNASLDDEKCEIVLKKYYHIGIGVDTPDGLIAVVLRDVDKKGILQIAKELQELSEKARNRTASLHELRGSNFTITNIGSLGGIASVPIINYPEVAILGVHRIKEHPVVIDSKIVVRNMMNVSLCFDHRVLDGAHAARFVNEVKQHLENPSQMLAKSM